MSFEYIFFDLDGTLTESKEGITKSIAYALSKMSIEPPPLKELEKYIGPPLVPCFMSDYNMTKEDAEKTLMFYRERFLVTGMYENAVYKGVKAMLERLNKNGKTLFVATTKPTPQAKGVLDHFGLTEFFYAICGSDTEGTKVEKDVILKEAIGKMPEIDLAKAIMVGDRKYDVAGAKANNIPCVGVTYGYGTEQELMEAGADFIVESVEQLEAFLYKY